jgi:hypothetical protein
MSLPGPLLVHRPIKRLPGGRQRNAGRNAGQHRNGDDHQYVRRRWPVRAHRGIEDNEPLARLPALEVLSEHGGLVLLGQLLVMLLRELVVLR